MRVILQYCTSSSNQRLFRERTTAGASSASMKIFLIYDEGPGPDHKLAITLPSKWLDQSADKVKECFVERYNKKFPDNELDDEELVLSVKDDSPFTNRAVKYLTSSDTPGKCFVPPSG